MKKLATRLLAVLMAVALLPLTLVSTASAEEPVTITIWGSDRENMPFRNGLETIESHLPESAMQHKTGQFDRERYCQKQPAAFR